MKTRKNNSGSGFTLIEVIITLVVVAIVAAMMASYFGTSITQSSLPIFRLKVAARLNDVMEKISTQYGQYSHWQPNTTYAAGAIILPPAQKRTGLLYTTASGGTTGAMDTEPTDWLQSSVPDNGFAWTPYTVAPPTLINLAWLPNKLYSANTIIVNGSYQYITPNGGTTGATTPTWASATTIGGLVPSLPDGVIWKCCGTPAPTVILQTLIGPTEDTDYDNTYGRYKLIHNRFIKFDRTNSPATEVDLTGNPTDADYGKYLKVTIGLRSDDADRTGETLTTLFVLR